MLCEKDKILLCALQWKRYIKRKPLKFSSKGANKPANCPLMFLKVMQEMSLEKLNSTHVIQYIFEPMEMTMETFSLSNVFTFIGIILGITLYYWVFHVPIDWKRCLEDVSYDLALGRDRNLKSKQKRDTINRMRRLRKIGINELPPPYPNGWYCIVESSAVKKEESINVACLGEQFVVFRTATNKVYVLDAYCPHLGANLGIGGKVLGDSIECPFHQWAFRGSDGKCVNVPYSSCGAPSSSKIRHWISKEMHEMIFIWYHIENEEPWELPEIEEVESKEYVYQGRNEFIVSCHIQEIPENGADLAHFTAIHNPSILAGSSPKDNPLSVLGTHRWDATWKGSNPETKHISTLSLKHLLEIYPKVQFCQVDVIGVQIGPAYVQLHMKSIFGRFVAVQTVTPIEPLVQKVVHRFYGPRLISPFMKFIVIAESIMVERDINMWNHKTYRNKPHLVKEDHTIKSFRNWYSQFYSDNSKSFAHAQENLDW